MTAATGERRCPVCRGSRAVPLFAKEGIDYWSCPDCAFRFATPDRNPNLTNTLDEYEDAYLQYLSPDPADAVNFDALYRWMTSVTPIAGKRLLDVGAGSGKLVRDLRRRGVDAHGIEPSHVLFDRFLGGEAAFTCASLDEMGAGTPPFPVVTAFDVIEHVADPVAFLERVAATLAPGGVFFLSTPDVESLTARLFGRRWHFYYPYHLSYFGARTLARTAAAAGLRAVTSNHRGRRRSVGYMIRYAAEFIGGAAAPAWAGRFDGWYLPVNLFDTMYVAFRRE
jgi:2-polyprenyl-3-methyl-5-hydroxy-6-metoxy-1,4-benzoquinol methylase